MGIDALGYIGVRARDLDDWAGYGSNFLGLQRIDKSRSTLAFRMDDRKQRLMVDADGGQGISFFGWEVADAAALAALAGRLEAAGTRVARGSRALAGERHVADLIVFNDPAGNRLEAFYGAETASEPFKPGRIISGFRTGPLGMGHVVMHFERIAEVMSFYADVLGFKLSDYWLRPFPAYFFHVNPRHHSIAFVESGTNMIHHMMVELYSFDDVGQGYDIALGEPRVAAIVVGQRKGRLQPDRLVIVLNGAVVLLFLDISKRAEAKEGGVAGGEQYCLVKILHCMVNVLRAWEEDHASCDQGSNKLLGRGPVLLDHDRAGG